MTNDYTAYIAGTAAQPLLGSITVTTGDVQNSGGTINLTGTALNVLAGNVYNSDTGVLNVGEDINAPSALGVVAGNLNIANGNLNITGGSVSVEGSSITIGNEFGAGTYALNIGQTAGNLGGSFSISDDALGNLSTFNVPDGNFGLISISRLPVPALSPPRSCR